MKKLITICLLLATAFSAKSQTFEETVNYINSKLTCCAINYSDTDYKTESFTANSNGILTVKRSNDVEYKIDILALYEDLGESPIYADNENVNFKLTLNKLKIWRLVSNSESERVVKALLHLKSLCKKDKELFDK